jgi:hypothetical protein
MVNAIAGRQAPNVPPGGVPWNPDDFKRQVAAMEAAKQSVPQTSTDIGGGELRPTQSPSLAEKPLNPIEQQMMALVRPQPNDDFARQAAAMEAAKGPPVHPADESSIGGGPVRTPNLFGPNATPVTPAEQAMMALVRPGAIPNTPAVPATAPDSAAPVPPISGRVPLPMPRPAMPLPTGSAIPGAVGPTSVGGAPLVEPPLPPPFGPVSTNGKQLPQGAGLPPATLVNAIAGRPMPAAGGDAGAPAPAAGGGAPAPAAPIQVAQNGPPTGGAPTGAGGPPGLPQPLTSPVGQINPQQLTQMLANPWVPDSAKAAMLQMIQQRGQPQSMPVEGGTLMFNAAGQKVFIPEPKFGTVKIGSAEIPTVSHFDPATRQWQTTTLSPGGGVQSTGAPPSSGGGDMPHPAAAQPDLSTIGGIQAAEAAQAGAKKAAETGGEATAKYYDSLHKGLAGSAMIAAQQKQNIDMLRQVAATPNFTPGAGSEAALGLQRLAAQFGINPEGAAPREIFNQVATRILADQISGIKSMASETGETGGKIFKSMLEMEEKANITPEDTASGVNAKINIIDQAGNLMMKWGDMADDYVAKHGKLDAGFDKTLRGEISKARIPDIVPKAAAVPSAPSEVSGLEAEMRRRGLLKDQPATAPVSQ